MVPSQSRPHKIYPLSGSFWRTLRTRIDKEERDMRISWGEDEELITALSAALSEDASIKIHATMAKSDPGIEETLMNVPTEGSP